MFYFCFIFYFFKGDEEEALFEQEILKFLTSAARSMPLFDINEFWDSDAQIGGLGFGSQPLKSRFLNTDRQRQSTITAAIEAHKAFCPHPKLL